MSLARYYYTGPEIRAFFGWSSRAVVSQTAKREGWKSVTLGTSKLYKKADVDCYRLARERTQLAQQVTWLGVSNRLVRDDTFDIKCPTCKGFAIREKDKTAEVKKGNGKRGSEWVCVNGHNAPGMILLQKSGDD